MDKKNSLREKLIIAGLEELSIHGYQNFSVRRIAAQCNVSCAAPYKHFKNKQDYIAAIIDYIKQQWNIRQTKIIKENPDSLRNQIIETALEYIRFLVEYPEFRSILMQKNSDFDQEYGPLRNKLSVLTTNMIKNYCESVSMEKEDEIRKTYVIRSLIYGAALMFDNGEMPYTDENMKYVAYSIEREFDLA